MRNLQLTAVFRVLLAILLTMGVARGWAQTERPATGTVTGLVTDGEMPQGGAVVLVEGTQTAAYTNFENGRFTLAGVPVGEQSLRITFLGYDTIRKSIFVEAGAVTDVGRLTLQTQGVALRTVEINATMRDGESKALNMTMVSTRVVNVVSADVIAKLPDKNGAEVVQRIPAVAIQRDQGEGRFVSIRGTPFHWNSNLVNGDRLPAADEENASRTVPLDIIPSDLIQYVALSKTFTPDIEGDFIGGSLNFMTKTAPEKRTIVANVSVGYNAQSMRPLASGSLLWGDRSKNKKFGYVLSAGLFYRNWGTDNFEVVYGSNFNHGINRLELRDYLGQRMTLGTNAAMEYVFKPGKRIYFRGFFSRMTDEEWNRKMMYNWAVGAGQTVRMQHIHNILTNEFFGGELGTELQLNPKLELKARVAGYSTAFYYGPIPFKGQDRRNGYYVIEFERYNMNYTDMVFVDINGNPLPNSIGAFRLKLIGDDYREYNNPDARGDAWDRIIPKFTTPLRPQDFEFNKVFTELNRTRESDPFVAQVDLKWTVGPRLTVKGGVKARMKYGSRQISLHEWLLNYPVIQAKAFFLTDFATEPLPRRGGFLTELGTPYADSLLMPFLTESQHEAFLNRMRDSLLERPMNSDHPEYEQWGGSSYTYQEHVGAGYLMAEYKPHSKVELLAGIRLEYTWLRMVSDTVLPFYIDPITQQIIYPVGKVAMNQSYVVPLPAISVKYSPVERMNIRFSATQTYIRPNFNQTKPGNPVIDRANLEFVRGNRELQPSFSTNLDFMFEYQFKDVGLVSAGVFYKNIRQHIFATSTADADIRTSIIFKSFQNATLPSHVGGVEFQLLKRFSFLPGFLKGFGVNLNYAYVYSRMKVPGRSFWQSLDRQSQHVGNAVLFYENEKLGLNIRLALNVRDGYLMEINGATLADSLGRPRVVNDNTDFDVFMAPELRLDLFASWTFKKRWTLFAEFNNLTNYPMRIYRGKIWRPVQTEFYDWRGQMGVRYTF